MEILRITRCKVVPISNEKERKTLSTGADRKSPVEQYLTYARTYLNLLT